MLQFDVRKHKIENDMPQLSSTSSKLHEAWTIRGHMYPEMLKNSKYCSPTNAGTSWAAFKVPTLPQTNMGPVQIAAPCHKWVVCGGPR